MQKNKYFGWEQSDERKKKFTYRIFIVFAITCVAAAAVGCSAQYKSFSIILSIVRQKWNQQHFVIRLNKIGFDLQMLDQTTFRVNRPSQLYFSVMCISGYIYPPRNCSLSLSVFLVRLPQSVCMWPAAEKCCDNLMGNKRFVHYFN